MTEFMHYLERYWHRLETLWVILILTILGLGLLILDINELVPGDLKSFSDYLYPLSLLGIPVSMYWWFSHSVTKTPLDKIGFLVSIKSECIQESIAIKRDFGNEIVKLLRDTPIHVIQLSLPYVNKVIDYESALKYSNKCRAHFHIYGDIRKRRIKNKEVYALRLEGMVRHAPTSLDNQRGLSKEMKEILPLNIDLPLEDDLRGFEFTSAWMAESTKYVIATAAMLSGDNDLAIHLLEELNSSKKLLERKLKKSPATGVRTLLMKLPERLAKAYLLASQAQHLKWRETRDISDLKQGWNHIQKCNNLIKNSLNFYVYEAIWRFVSQRDLSGSLKSIMSCVALNISDPTWRYSAAFLESYRGNEGKALQFYETAIDFGVRSELFLRLKNLFHGYCL